MGQRLSQLRSWIKVLEAAGKGPVGEEWELTPVSGDASFRRYFRVKTASSSWIAVDAPPEKEDSAPFVNIARSWIKQGVIVPEVVAADLKQGFMLLGDFGDQLLLPMLNKESVERLYARAVDELFVIQQSSTAGLPWYDEVLLGRELELFPTWFLSELMGYHLNLTERKNIENFFEQLISNAIAQPQITVHRDFHSRNLMLLDENDRLGVIDFQDAVRGPITYDLVSLLKDCYIAWPRSKVCDWVESYREQAVGLNLLSADVDSNEFLRWFDLMGLQRHIKVLGIFSRLSIRDGKSAYLKDIPLVLNYVLEMTSEYAEFSDINTWLEREVVPRMQTLGLCKEAGV